MTTHVSAPAAAADLDQLQQQFDDCLLRDIPVLRRRLAGLRRRMRRGQATDRGLAALRQDIEHSCRVVRARRESIPQPDYPRGLPVVERREQILELLERNQVLILCGETGSGKTTQLPKLCLELGRGVRGRIGHTQPRRIAARSLASRIAEELHVEAGGLVGYRVRFHDRVGAQTAIKIMTDGMLLAEIQSDPDLLEYDTLIIDEAHERSLNIDFLLGYLKHLLPRRPDLKLVITSATIDPQRFADHFGGAPVLEVSGRTWPVEIRYRPLAGEDEDQRERDRGQALLEAVDELAREGPGDILVFLPGERAIREAAERLRKHHPPHTEILPLYARLSPQEQARVFQPHAGRRIVLATNVAETSLTVPGIRYVVDTGLARISRYSYRSKVQRLPVEAISQASARQRAGRCGRVQAGICVRLYSEPDFLSRPVFTEPEIQRTSLAAVILQMAALGLGRVEDFPFVDPPDGRLVRDGYRLLQELDAVDAAGALTPRGRKLSRLPLDPRLGRMLLEADRLGCLNEVLVIVAVLETADPRDRPLEHARAADERHVLFQDPRSDFLSFLNLWRAWREQSRKLSQNRLRKWCREHFLSWLRMREWTDIQRQLREQAAALGLRCNEQPADYEAIHRALLSGLLGHVAMKTDEGEYLGARSQQFRLFPGSALAKKKPRWVVAAERVDTGQRYLRTVAAIEPDWVEELAGPLLKRHYSEPHWEKKLARVAAFEKVTLYGLPLVARRRVDYGPVEPGLARERFIRHALVQGEFDCREAFMQHNRQLLEEVEQWEARERRRDIRVDDDVLYAFFDERIPAEVRDGPGFYRWWKRKRAKQPRWLHLDRALLVREGAERADEDAFPSRLCVRGLELPLEYCFEPGREDDGMQVQLPLAALNQIEDADFDWLVPGLVEEKLTALIRSLPKSLRRHFVPAPEFARAVMQAVCGREVPVTQLLGRELERMTGVTVPADAWRPERLPRHLQPLYVLRDGERVLASDRSLARLKARYGGRARGQFATLADDRFSRRDVCDWDFGELPQSVDQPHDGLVIRAWPALASRQDRIELRLFDNAAEAQQAHARGLLALYRLRLGRRVREIRKAAPEWQQQVLWFSPLGDAGQLAADLEQAVLQAAFTGGCRAVRTEDEFRSCLEQGSARLLELAVEIGRSSRAALKAWHALQGELGKALSPERLQATREVQAQAGALVYPGFLAATPLDRLPRLGVYLEAMRLRLDRLAGNVARDRQSARLLAGWRERLEKARARAKSDPQALEDFRWKLEELAVSLFAQELGTAEKVSPERLERAWKAL